jgi:hypothetical protein
MPQTYFPACWLSDKSAREFLEEELGEYEAKVCTARVLISD